MARASAKEKAIKNYMEKLQISREEAQELWMFDNNEISHPEVDRIEALQKAQAKPKESSTIKVKHMKAKEKEDVTRDEILAAFEAFLEEKDLFNAPQSVAKNKFVFKSNDGNFYTVAVTKNRKKPDGYKDL